MAKSWTSRRLLRQIRRTFRWRTKIWCRNYLSDPGFTLLSRETVCEVIDAAEVYRRPYITDKWDCDNSARALKVAVDEHGRDQPMRFGYAFGTIWGDFGDMKAHAVCFFADLEGRIVLVEPQHRRTIWYPTRADRGIWKFEA